MHWQLTPLFLAFVFAVLYSEKGANSAVTKTTLNIGVMDVHAVEQSPSFCSMWMGQKGDH